MKPQDIYSWQCCRFFFPFPWLLEESASQASCVVTPEMKQLRKMSWATTQYSCHPKDLKYRLPQLPEDHGLQAPGYFWALKQRVCPPASSKAKIAKQLLTSQCLLTTLPLGPTGNRAKCTKPDTSPHGSLLPGLAQKRISGARWMRRSKREIRSHVAPKIYWLQHNYSLCQINPR